MKMILSMSDPCTSSAGTVLEGRVDMDVHGSMRAWSQHCEQQCGAVWCSEVQCCAVRCIYDGGGNLEGKCQD